MTVRAYRHWMASDLVTIRSNPDLNDTQLAKMIGTTKLRVSAFRRRHGIRKPDNFAAVQGALYWKG